MCKSHPQQALSCAIFHTAQVALNGCVVCDATFRLRDAKESGWELSNNTLSRDEAWRRPATLHPQPTDASHLLLLIILLPALDATHCAFCSRRILPAVVLRSVLIAVVLAGSQPTSEHQARFSSTLHRKPALVTLLIPHRAFASPAALSIASPPLHPTAGASLASRALAQSRSPSVGPSGVGVWRTPDSETDHPVATTVHVIVVTSITAPRCTTRIAHRLVAARTNTPQT